jgi:hypothetical protein
VRAGGLQGCPGGPQGLLAYPFGSEPHSLLGLPRWLPGDHGSPETTWEPSRSLTWDPTVPPLGAFRDCLPYFRCLLWGCDLTLSYPSVGPGLLVPREAEDILGSHCGLLMWHEQGLSPQRTLTPRGWASLVGPSDLCSLNQRETKHANAHPSWNCHLESPRLVIFCLWGAAGSRTRVSVSKTAAIAICGESAKAW